LVGSGCSVIRFVGARIEDVYSQKATPPSPSS
jgi:hypothetical protein